MEKWGEELCIGWDLYFPEDFSGEDPRLPVIQQFVNFFSTEDYAESLKQASKENNSIPLDYAVLSRVLPEKLKELLQDEPGIAIPCLGMAIFIITNEDQPGKLNDPELVFGLQRRKLTPRIFNYNLVTPFRQLKSNLIGKFVTIRGTVVRVGNIKPLVSRMDFQCSRCGTVMSCYFKEGRFKSPTKCSGDNCRSKLFIPQYSTAVCVDWQKIRLQEQMDKKDPGRVPRTIECEITDDLVDSCVPGDIVTISGIVKAQTPEQDKNFKKDKSKALFVLYIDANSIDNAKNIDNEKVELMNFQMKELFAIQEILNEPNIFRLIVQSICPGIYGNEIVKAGLALCLFGGCQKNFLSGQERSMTIRGDPHMLIVGDPGLGKSQMLTAVSNIAPRSVYVCGSYSSTTGLTVTLLKESGSGDYALEAGALVLADHGCCCIDEFDKMASEHEALLEAMEQQSISIAKAGIVCTLPARTSVIAAANPVGGHYNRAKTVCENLKMNAALLSRFDLIFILLDKPDEERDHMLSEHVMQIHGGNGISRTGTASRSQDTVNSFEKSPSQESRVHLLEKLKKPGPKEDFEPLHPILLRKYIGYAKKYVHPRLSSAACKVIQTFYLSLREKHRTGESTPITTRQLESLIRLSEARAKLELREEVTEQDAQDVIEIMRESLFERFEDEYGNIDFRRSSGMSKSKQVSGFINQLQRWADQKSSSVFTFNELQQLGQKMGIEHFEQFLDNLNTQNYLLKKGSRQYKLMTSSYS